jgi:hypothetical protein
MVEVKGERRNPRERLAASPRVLDLSQWPRDACILRHQHVVKGNYREE